MKSKKSPPNRRMSGWVGPRCPRLQRQVLTRCFSYTGSMTRQGQTWLRRQSGQMGFSGWGTITIPGWEFSRLTELVIRCFRTDYFDNRTFYFSDSLQIIMFDALILLISLTTYFFATRCRSVLSGAFADSDHRSGNTYCNVIVSIR